jgi:hypothetical protein
MWSSVVAVVLHGHTRFTADLDLVSDLDPDAARKTTEALEGLGLAPRVPVPAVDLFVESPIPFEELWERAEVMRIGRADVRVAAIPDLARMKQAAGRPATSKTSIACARSRGRGSGAMTEPGWDAVTYEGVRRAHLRDQMRLTPTPAAALAGGSTFRGDGAAARSRSCRERADVARDLAKQFAAG